MKQKPYKDHINLGHGSGGLLTRELLDRVIFKTFDNPYLGAKHDGAILDLKGPVAVSTDSFVVSPVFFKGGDIGELAIHGTVNDVAMCGAIPRFVSLAFIVEEGFPMDDFERVVTSVKNAADSAGVQVITGDTKVVEQGSADKIFINTTGIGELHQKARISLDRVQPGDAIIVSGSIARHGMAIMTQREGLQFESDITSDTTNLNGLVASLLDVFGEQIKLLRDPTRGGVSAVLSEIAADRGLGVDIHENLFPIQKQVAAACEILGIDPLYVANEGVFMVVVDQAIADKVVELLKKDPKGREASRIGQITDRDPGKVIMHSSLGGKRVVTPLIGEQLPRIC